MYKNPNLTPSIFSHLRDPSHKKNLNRSCPLETPQGHNNIEAYTGPARSPSKTLGASLYINARKLSSSLITNAASPFFLFPRSLIPCRSSPYARPPLALAAAISSALPLDLDNAATISLPPTLLQQCLPSSAASTSCASLCNAAAAQQSQHLPSSPLKASCDPRLQKPSFPCRETADLLGLLQLGSVLFFFDATILIRNLPRLLCSSLCASECRVLPTTSRYTRRTVPPTALLIFNLYASLRCSCASFSRGRASWSFPSTLKIKFPPHFTVSFFILLLNSLLWSSDKFMHE